ncbi:Peptidase family M28 [Natronincola peptidivorans]|uniref:Peptidase family M28 n=1 Tax=Natronincola peptidivorans TaxID=426128 RepID=A0A1I0E711_9FIRM|nr:M28 family peptidase [Natronincola peptidivorans]SET40779.1 Peptidase family M28 [Natronincola peptidivorans]
MESSVTGKELIDSYLKKLTLEIDERSVGSSGNNQAVDYFYIIMKSLGYDLKKDGFDCIDWECGKVYLRTGEEQYEAFASPFSLPCDINAELVVVSTLEELRTVDAHEKILLIHKELTQEQIMPKNFIFYNPEEHKQMISLLEEKNPKAIICVTGCVKSVSVCLHPFPIFEDGDFDIPSVYMKDIDGEKLIKLNGLKVELTIESKRNPAKGYNVVARKKGEGKGRVVLCAHIDTKKNTPGALDNATGVAVLMALAEQLRDYKASNDIEFVAFNGEDYYSVPGQMLYLKQNNGDFQDIKMVINIDGAGHKDSKTAVSFYNLRDDQKKEAMISLDKYKTLVKGEKWYEGDHSMFLQKGVPCIAVTSSNVRDVVMNITHTPKDTMNNVNIELLCDLVKALKDIISNIF